MKFKNHISMISFFLLLELLTISFPLSAYTCSLPCHCDDEYNSLYTDENNELLAKYMDIFQTESNIKFLNNTERKTLEDIQNKLSTNNMLDIEDFQQMSVLKDIVFKNKLSEVEYNDFKEILSKK